MECWRCPQPLAPAHPWPLLQRRSSGLRDLRTVIAMTSTWRRAGDISSFVLCCHKPRLTCREASDKRNPVFSEALYVAPSSEFLAALSFASYKQQSVGPQCRNLCFDCPQTCPIRPSIRQSLHLEAQCRNSMPTWQVSPSTQMRSRSMCRGAVASSEEPTGEWTESS